VAEVIDVLVRRDGRDLDDVLERLDWLAAGGLVTVPIDDGVARAAGRIRASHYRRVGAPVSLADCLALATAQVLGRALASADPDLCRVVASEGVEVIALPGASGRLPAPDDQA
jgi:predicted nucleic acid-binding protein